MRIPQRGGTQCLGISGITCVTQVGAPSSALHFKFTKKRGILLLEKEEMSFLPARKGTQFSSDKIFRMAAPPKCTRTRAWQTPGLSKKKKTCAIPSQRDLWRCLWRYVLLHFRFGKEFMTLDSVNIRLTWVTSR